MKKVYKLATVLVSALLVAVALHVVTGYGLDGVKKLGTEPTRYGVEVSYYKELFRGQSLVVSLNDLGKGYTTCITLWGWAPNGSIVALGKKCSTKSSIRIPAKPLIRYLEDWRRALLRNHDDPGSVEPGVIVMTAINKPGRAVYSLIKAAPINIPLTLSRKASVKITIAGSEVRHALLKPVATWSQLAKTRGSSNRHGKGPGKSVATTTEWPPRNVPGAPTGGPYYWHYQATIAENNNAYLPVEILHLHGYLQHFENDAIDIQAVFSASSSEKIGFTATYAVSTGLENVDAQFGVSGPVHTIGKSSKHVYYAIALAANYDKDRARVDELEEGISSDTPSGAIHQSYIYPLGVGNDVLLAIGYKGQAALAEYCLAYDFPSMTIGDGDGTTYTCTNTWANLTLHRPIEVSNKILYWYEVDNNPNDGEGVAESIYKVLSSKWSKLQGEEVYGEPVWIHLDDVIAEFNTIPILSVSIPVIPAILGPEAATLPAILTPVFGATVGYTSNKIETTFISLILNAGVDTDVAFNVYWLYSPQKMYYKGSYYYLGTAIFDVDVSKMGGGPHPCPPGGGCPTGSRGSGGA